MSVHCGRAIVVPHQFEAAAFDLDGADTARLHAKAWTGVFNALLRERTTPEGSSFESFTPEDYRTYVDGRPRLEAIRAFLSARGISLPEGEASDEQGLKLPTKAPSLVVIAHRYHLRPLIDSFSDAGRFHVLAATRDSVRFFDGAEREFDEVTIEGLPSSLDAIKGRTDFDDQAGYHATSRGSAASPKYHALGESPEDYEGVELGQFAQSIAKAVDSHLAGDGAPLVLVAQPRLLGRLRQALRYGNIADEDVQRDPTSMDDKALHAQTWEIADQILREPRDALRERCNAWVEGANIPGSDDLQELMRSADKGRIDTLLLARDANVWGTYDEDRREVTHADENAPDNEELLNLLALRTLRQGGDVISLSEELSEKTGPAVGLYRY